MIILKIFARFISLIHKYHLGLLSYSKKDKYFRQFDLHPTVKLFQVLETTFRGNISIGQYTYLNRCWIETGQNSKVQIGDCCAIGYNTYIMAVTHDINKPTGPQEKRPSVEADIVIGDFVWIGVNVYIREGVKIGNNTIIGANSVVTKDVPNNAIVGGVPAKIIRYKEDK